MSNYFLTARVLICMLEKIILRVFLVCLFSCASLVLSFLWGGDPAPLYFQIAASFFIIGLAAFLCWFILLLKSIRSALTKSS